MNTERRWVTVIDNSLGNITEYGVVKVLLDWYAQQGVPFEGYDNPFDRLDEGQSVLDFAQNYISDAALDAIRSEWLAGWMDYLLDLGDIEIHEDYSACYGYWEEVYSNVCYTCGATTRLRDENGNTECLDCLVQRDQIADDPLSYCILCNSVIWDGFCTNEKCVYGC
jgi:hypothetical protein